MNFGRNTSGSRKNRLARVLTSPDKGVSRTSGANGVLSRLWRQILFDLNIAPIRFGQLMQEYLLDPSNGVPPNKKDQTSMRGNLTKEFSREQMTWKVFMKGLRFLQWVRIELTIKAYHRNGSISEHKTNVDLGTSEDNRTFEEQLNQPESQEAVGDYIPVLDDHKEQELEMGKAATAGVLPNPGVKRKLGSGFEIVPRSWYVWSPSRNVVYEDLGNPFSEAPTPEQITQQFGKDLEHFSKIDPTSQLSQGSVLLNYEAGQYPSPETSTQQ